MSKKTHLSKFSVNILFLRVCVHMCLYVVMTLLVFVLDICACIVVSIIVSEHTTLHLYSNAHTLAALELGH